MTVRELFEKHIKDNDKVIIHHKISGIILFDRIRIYLGDEKLLGCEIAYWYVSDNAIQVWLI